MVKIIFKYFINIDGFRFVIRRYWYYEILWIFVIGYLDLGEFSELVFKLNS